MLIIQKWAGLNNILLKIIEMEFSSLNVNHTKNYMSLNTPTGQESISNFINID